MDSIKEFHSILNRLLSSEIQNEKELEDTIERLKRFYQSSNHKHSDVLQPILDHKKTIEIDSMTLAQNIRQIQEYLDKFNIFDEFRTRVERLFDHVNLECSHACVQAQIREEISTNTQNAILKIEDRVEEAEKNEIDFNDFFKKQQSQYITILGIFASIIMTFVGGLTFSTSVLSHMHEVSIYRLVFVICCIGALVFNVLFALFGFILKIVDKKVNYITLFVANIGFVIALGVNLYFFDHWGNDKKETPKQEANLSIQAKTK